MARSGISRYEVKKARQTLLSNGINPSIDAIRVELGNTGSKTTISRYLKEIELEESVQLEDEALLSEGIKELIAKLASKLQQEAQDIVERSEATHRATVEELKASNQRKMEGLTLKNKELDAAQSDIQALVSELENKKEHTTELELLVQKEQSEKQKLQAILPEKDSQIATLKENHQHARDSLVHYRESVKEQREQEQRQHEQQIRQLQNELRQLNQTLVVKQTDITQLNKDNSRLVTELSAVQKDNRKLEDKVKKLNQITDDLKQQLNQSQSMIKLVESERTESTKLSTALEEKLEAQSLRTRDLELKNAKLETELSLLKSSGKKQKS